MDDIYYSKDERKSTGREPEPEKRITPDKFIDADYGDESFDLEFKSRGNAQLFSDRPKTYGGSHISGEIPETKKPEPITGNRYSGTPTRPSASPRPTSRTPQGKRTVPVDSRQPVAPRNPQGEAQPRTVSRTPKGNRVAPGENRPAPDKKNGKPPKKSKGGKGGKIVLGVLSVILILLAALFAYGYSALGGLDYHGPLEDNKYIDSSKLLSDSSVRNILFIGSDARENLGGQRSDSMILFSIDKKNKKLKMTSFLRDSYVYIPSKQYHTRINAAFNYGGAQLLVDTIEYNFGVKIDDYLVLNYDAFIQLVDLLGGITIHDVTANEAKYMTEKVNIKNFKEGTNTINGRAAMWYCRIRYLDNDFYRTQRQRKVLSAIIEKASRTSPVKLVQIVEELLPNVSTSIDRNGLLSLGIGALLQYMHYDIEQQQIPAPKTWWNERINGMDVLRLDFDANKKILKEFIYE